MKTIPTILAGFSLLLAHASADSAKDNFKQVCGKDFMVQEVVAPGVWAYYMCNYIPDSIAYIGEVAQKGPTECAQECAKKTDDVVCGWAQNTCYFYLPGSISNYYNMGMRIMINNNCDVVKKGEIDRLKDRIAHLESDLKRCSKQKQNSTADDNDYEIEADWDKWELSRGHRYTTPMHIEKSSAAIQPNVDTCVQSCLDHRNGIISNCAMINYNTTSGLCEEWYWSKDTPDDADTNNVFFVY